MARRIVLLTVLALTVVIFAGGARRRAARPGPCPLPTVTLGALPGAVCSGEPFTLLWEASQRNAQVIISGFSTQQSATGSRYITNNVRTFTARATNGCSTGPAVTFTVPAPSSASGSLFAPASVNSGSTAVLQVTATGTWSLRSQLGNTIDPASGTGSRTVTYYGTRSGHDVVTLVVESSCGGSLDRAATIEVKASTPPPPPTTTYLRCCDGTFSKTCTSCSNKQGCCSGHGGVCSCPK